MKLMKLYEVRPGTKSACNHPLTLLRNSGIIEHMGKLFDKNQFLGNFSTPGLYIIDSVVSFIVLVYISGEKMGDLILFFLLLLS